MHTITVTSLADSGTGTLREAIALANAYTGTDEIQILIDESLAGQTIELAASLPSINKACSLIAPASGIVLSGYGLTTAVDLHMENVTQPSMVIEKCIALSGSGNVFTGSGQVLEIYDVYVNLQNFSAVAMQDDAYIKVSSALMAYPMQFNGTTTLGILGKGLNVYKFDSRLFIMDGACLNLESGVIMDCPEGVTVDYYYEPSILCAENATFRLGNSSLEVMGEADISRCIIDGTIVVSSYCSLRGSDVVFTGSGKVIELENADIDLSNLSATATRDDAYIGITNGSVTSKITLGVLGEGLDTYKRGYDILIRSGAELTLEDGVTTESQGLDVLEGGKLVAGASHLLLGTSNLSVSGEAELTGTVFVSTSSEPVTVSGGGNLTMTGCDVSKIGTRGNITLQDVTVTEQLCIRDGTVSGSGVVFTGSGRVIDLTNMDVSLANLSATATQEDAYIGINDRVLTGKRTFGILGEGLDTYKMENFYGVSIEDGAELSLEDGVTLVGAVTHYCGLRVREGGKLVAGAVQLLLGTAELEVEGEAELKGATISSTNAFAVWVQDGGKLTMTGCDVSACQRLVTNGALQLNDMSVRKIDSTAGDVSLQDVTVTEQLVIDQGTTVRGSGNVFTGSGCVIDLDLTYGRGASFDALRATATQEDAYIGITCGSESTNLTLCVLGDGLDTYRLRRGTLRGEIILEEGVIVESSDEQYFLQVRENGRVETSSVYYNSEWYASWWEFGDATNLTNVVVKGNLQGGILTLDSCAVEGSVEETEIASMIDCSVSGRVRPCQSCVIKNSTVNELFLGVYEPAVGECSYFCDGVVCQQLIFSEYYGSWTLETGDQGIIIEGRDAFDLSGDVSRLESFTWRATHEQACAWIRSVYGELKKIEGLSGGYKSDGLNVEWDRTLTFGEGVTVEMFAGGSIDGILNIRNQVNHDALVATSDEYEKILYVYGTVNLENSNVKGVSFNVWGSYNMEKGGLYAASLNVYEGGKIALSNCDLQESDVTVEQGGLVKITGVSGMRNLTIDVSSAEHVVTGNDFSNTQVVLTGIEEDEYIDLSGNYWGTTDMDEVIARIEGYVEGHVFISSILEAPPVGYFSFDASMYGMHRISDDADRIRVSFNREVDAATLNAESLMLLDAEGKQVEVISYEVEGADVILHINPLEIGQYKLLADEQLKDANGNAFAHNVLTDAEISYYSLTVGSPEVSLLQPDKTLIGEFSYVDIYFNQQMDSSSISSDSVRIYDAAGNEVQTDEVQRRSNKGNVYYRVSFAAAATPGNWRVEVGSAVKNEFGKSMESDFSRELYVSSVDLRVESLVEHENNAPGRYVTIRYSVSNAGDGEAVGGWTDSIYLCPTAEWDESQAVLFGRVQQKGMSLAPGAMYSGEVNARLDVQRMGDYYVFVKTDMFSQLYEEDETNNLSPVGTLMSVLVPEHAHGEQCTEVISLNEVIYYSFSATENGSMVFEFDAALGGAGDVNIGRLDGASAVAAVRNHGGNRQLYFDVQAGQTYYVSVKPTATGSFHSSLNTAPFALLGSSVTALNVAEDVTVKLSGSGMISGLKAYLEDEQGNRYDATCTYQNSCEVQLVFRLPEGLPNGTALTLHAENPGGELAVLDTPLNVATYGDVVDLSFDDMNGWSYQRVGYVWRSHLNVENARGADLDNAIILVTDTAEDFAMYYSYAEGSIRDRSALMFLGGAGDSSPNQLLAGEKDKLDIFVKNYRSSEGRIEAHVFDPTDTTAIAPGMWEQIASALRPATCEDETWAAWWSNMQPRIGTTVADFVSFVREMQHVSGKNTGSSLADLVDDIIRNHGGYAPSAGVWGALTDADGEGVQNAIVELYRITDGERELVSSLLTGEYGYFCFGKLEQGAQYELVCSESFMLGGNMVNSVTFVQEGVTTEQRWEMPPTASVKIAISGITGQLSEETAVYLTSADGRMVLLTYRNDAWVADGVLPGDYTLSAVEDGYSFAEKIVTVTEVSAENTFTISATRVVTLQGRLLNADGSMGVEDVCVALCQNGQVVAMAQTDESGHYVLSYIREGDYELRLDDAEGRLLTEITANNEQIDDILLNQGHTVSGSLRGAALGSTVSLYEGDVCKYTTLLKADGTYVFSGVAEGEYRLLVNDKVVYTGDLLVLSVGETSVEIPQQMVLEGVQLSGQAIGFELGYVVLYKQGNPVAVAQVGADCSFSFTVGEIGDFELQAVSAQSVESEVRQVQVTTLQDDYTVQLLPISGGVEFVNSVEMTDDAICSIVPMGNNVRGTTWLKDSDVELTNSKIALTPGDYVLLIEDNGRFIRQCFTVKSGSYARLQIGDWFDCGSLSVVVEDAAPVSDNEQMTFSVCDMGTGEVVDVFSVKKGDVVNVGNLLPGTYKVIATGVNSNVYCDEVININESETITVNLSPVEMVNYVSGYCTGGDTEFNSQIQVTLIGNDGFEISSTPVNSDGSYKVAVPIDFESGKLVFRNETTGHTTEINVSSESTEYNVSIDYREEDIFIPNESAVSDAYRLVAKRFLTARADDSYESVESQPVATAESELKWNPIFLKVNRLKERFECEIHDSLVTFPYVGKTDCCDASALAMMLEEQNRLHTEIEQNIKEAFNLKREYVSQGAQFLFAVIAIGLPLTRVGPQVASIVGVGTVVISMTSIIKELSKLAVDLTPENVLDTLYSVADSLLDIGGALPDVFNHPNEVELLAESLQSLWNNVTNHENLVRLASSNLVDVDDLKDNIRAVNDLIIQDAERIKDLYNQMPALKHLFGGDNAVAELDKIITNANKNKDFISQKNTLRPRHITRHVKLFNASDSASWVRAIRNSRLVSRVIPIVGAILDMLDIGELIETFRNYEKLVEQIDQQMYLLGHIIKNASDQKENYLSCIETQGDDCKPDPDAELPHKNFQSYDPNDIYGPEGYGAQNWIGRQEMMFEVVCENIPEENIAHAAMVTIKQQIDAAYDYSTFRLGDMMIAGNYIEVTGDVQHFQERVDWTETLGVLVDVNAFFDADTGEVTWEFVAIDPETGYVVADPFTGLLAPNYNPPEGDGGVKYYVTPKETTASGTVMQSQAEIIFDFNEPIDTPLLKYTLDGDNPVAVVQSVSESAAAGYLLVRWGGTDVGSGIKAYDVYVSVDGGEWQLWQDDISFDRALYAKLVGEHSYAFYAVAMDYAGNAEAVTEVVSAESSLVSTHTDAESSLTVNSVQAVRAGDELTLSIAFSEQAVCADWAAALLVSTSAQNIDLSAGTFRYDATTHVLTWVGTVAGVPDGAQATVRLTDGAVTDANGLPFGSTVPAYTAPIELAGVVGSTYAAPALVDYNKDGLVDVLVGEVAENGKGRIRIYLNEGTAEVASFASFIYASTEEDTPLELAATGCQGAIVRFADITGDGKDEMVVGLADGTIRIFTAAEVGYWADSGELTCAVGGESETVDVGTRAAIEFVDANGDGRTDLLVGTGDGNVLLYLNTSAEGAAAFDAGRYLHDAAGRIDVGSRATVATGDFDGDGLWDMLLGTADGTVLFYRNEGSTGTPLFGATETVFAGDALLDMSSETNRVRIDTGDLDGDGIDDLVVGQSDGKVKLLYGTDGADVIGETDILSSPDITAPVVTLNEPELKKIADGKIAVTFSWSCSESAVYTLTVDGKDYALGTATSHTLELADGEHSYSVKATDAAGNVGTAGSSFAMDATAPEAVQGVLATTGKTGVSISWAAVADAATYTLQYATKSDFSDAQTVEGITDTAHTLTGLPGTGTLYVRVSAADAAGNESGWSAPAQTGLDITAPDAVQGLVSLAHGTSARLNWAAANDVSGISGYRLQYAVNGDFSKAYTIQVNGLETIFYTLQSNTTFQWRVAAVDGVGNIGAWSAVASFRTGAAEPADDSVSESHEIEMSLPAGGESLSSSPVSGWVGFDDPTDFYSFTAKGAGTYAVHLDSAIQGTQVFLSVGTLDAEGNFAAAQKLVVAPGSASSALGGIVLEKGEQCFIRVDSYDKGLGRYNGEYTLSVEAEVPEPDILTDNNTLEKATVLAESSAADARLNGWVGAGDAVDYYRFQLQDAAELTLVLDELESSVKVKLLHEQNDGRLSQVLSRSVKSASGLDRTLSLTSGTYFVEISSFDNGAGRYNSTYALELEKEEDGEVKRYAIAGSGL